MRRQKERGGVKRRKEKKEGERAAEWSMWMSWKLKLKGGTSIDPRALTPPKETKTTAPTTSKYEELMHEWMAVCVCLWVRVCVHACVCTWKAQVASRSSAARTGQIRSLCCLTTAPNPRISGQIPPLSGGNAATTTTQPLYSTGRCYNCCKQ